MNKKIKVLYFVDRLLIGGIQTFILNNIKNMDRTNIQIDFLILDDGNRYDAEEEVKKLGCNVYVLDGVWLNSAIDFINYRKKLKGFFKNHHDYKVVHMHSSSKNYMVLKYAKKYGIPVRIAHAHSVTFQTKSKIKKIIGSMFIIPLKKYATDYFACSKISGRWLYGDREVENGNVNIFRNAVDYEKFKPNMAIRKSLRKKLRINEDDIVLGHVGRFDEVKNHTFLVDVFYEVQKQNNNSKLLLVGIGPLEDEIKEKVKKLNIENKVIFTGFVNNVNDYLQAMDVFMMPSIYEGFPIVAVEAQASGLPCFVSKDVITDEIKITDCVNFISLNDSAKEWSKIILSSDLLRKNNMKKLKKAGYFIKDTAKELEEFYINS